MIKIKTKDLPIDKLPFSLKIDIKENRIKQVYFLGFDNIRNNKCAMFGFSGDNPSFCISIKNLSKELLDKLTK